MRTAQRGQKTPTMQQQPPHQQQQQQLLPTTLFQQHATILSEARSNVSGFAAAMNEAKHSCPGDRSDIRALVATLERASKGLSSELGRSISKLKALNDAPLPQSSAAFGPPQQQNPDLLSALASAGMPNSLVGGASPNQQQPGSQNATPGNPPYDFPFHLLQQQQNGINNTNGLQNVNYSNFPFINDTQGPNASSSMPAPFIPALAQFISQGQDGNRMNVTNPFQNLNPMPNPLGQQGGPMGMDLNSLAGLHGSLLNGANLGNGQVTLAALSQLGFTPNMLEALCIGAGMQQSSNTPVGPQQQQARGSEKTSGTWTPVSEPSRKKRKHGRSKLGESNGNPGIRLSLPLPPHLPMSMPPSTTPPLSQAATNSSGLPPGVTVQPGEKRMSTLGVGLRQEGDKRYRNRKLLRDLREHLYRWLGTNEFRKLKNTYKVAEWVPNPNLSEEEKAATLTQTAGSSSAPPITTHIFHVDFTSRDFYRTNQVLIDAIVMEGSKKVEARPEAYDIVPGTIDRDHLEDVAKDLMDSARSGFRMSLRTGVQAEKEDKEKHEKYRGVERAKTKCRNREIGAGRLRHSIPRQLLVPGAYSDDAASDEDLHGLTKSEWKRQRLRKLRIAKGWEAVTPAWRNKHLTKAYHKADIVSKSKQMARWRRDAPVDLPFPIKLYGKTLPLALFDPDWLAENRKILEHEPYFVKIDDTKVKGWEESHHPLGEDTSDEMEWSDANPEVVKEGKRGTSEEEVGASSTSGGVEQESASGESNSSSSSDVEGM